MLERFIGHHGAEVGAANTDIHDISDRGAGVAPPLTRTHAIGELRHPVEHAMNLRHDVYPIDEDGRPARCAQRHMQNRPILGGVDLFSAKHRFDAGLQANLIGKLDQQGDCLVGDAVLGIVEIDADGFRAHPLGTARVVLEQRPQMETFGLFVVAFERFPCRAGNQRRQG